MTEQKHSSDWLKSPRKMLSRVTEKPSGASGSRWLHPGTPLIIPRESIISLSSCGHTSLKQLQCVCFGFVLMQPKSRSDNSSALGLILLLPGSFRKENRNFNNCRYLGGAGSFQWSAHLKSYPNGTSQPLTEYLSCCFFTQHTSWIT